MVTTALLLLSFSLPIALALGFVALDRASWLRRRVHKHVFVHTDDETIEGDLWAVHRDGLVLVNGRTSAGKLPGETFIPRAEVRLVQHAEPTL